MPYHRILGSIAILGLLIATVPAEAVVAAEVAASAAQQQDAGQDDEAADDDHEEEDEENLERRNPRRDGRGRGRGDGPRMVAGGLSIGGGGDDLRHYTLLEPMIGTFTFEGSQWRRSDGEAQTFNGTWANTWELDGQYMKCIFTIDDGSRVDYQSTGYLCYDGDVRRYEGVFMNNRNTRRITRSGTMDEDGKTLTLFGLDSRIEAVAEPDFKVLFEIADDDHFTYSGYQLSSETGEWWKQYELHCTRVPAEAASADDGESGARDETNDDGAADGDGGE